VDLLNIKIVKSCKLSLTKKIEAGAESVGLQCIACAETGPGFSLIAKLYLKIFLLASEFMELSILKENIFK